MKKTNLAKNTILLSIGTLMTKGINLLMIPLFSSWLSTEDYGSFDLLCTYVSLLIPFVTLSSSDAIFRFCVDKDDDIERSRHITAGFFINGVNTLIVCAIIMGIGIWGKWDTALPFIVLLVTELFNNHLQGFMRAIKKLNVYSFASVITTFGIATSVTVFVLLFDMGLKGIVYGYAMGYLLGEVILVCITKYWRFLKWNLVKFSDIKELVRYAYPLIPNNICWWIINVSDRTLIRIFLGAASNGIYAIAYKIPNFCASIFNVFSISWQEAAVDLVDSDERNAYYNDVYNRTTATMISLCGGLLALNYFLFRYIFDIRYFGARLFSPILITSVIFGSLTMYFGGIQISLKRTKENGLTTMLGALVNLVIDLALIQSIGLYAAALSTLISNIAICAARYVRLTKDIHFHIDKRTWLYIGYYVYLLFMSYSCNSMSLSLLNLILSCVMFCVINLDFVLNFLLKLHIIRQ